MAGRIAEAMLPGLFGGILLYASALDWRPEAMGAEHADRIFCFYDMQGAGLRQSGSVPEIAGQTTWEAFS